MNLFFDFIFRDKSGGVPDKLKGKLGGVQKSLERIPVVGKGLGSVAGGLSGLVNPAGLATAGLTALVGVVAKGISDFVALADKVRNFQRVSGASAEESSRFVAVLDDLKIEAETGSAAIFRMSKNIEANAAALAKNGIQIARNADGTVNLTETLLNVSDAYNRAQGGAAKNAVATAAFGKSGAALIPILERSRAELKAMFDEVSEGQILDQRELEKARDYELAMDDLGDAVGDLSRELGSKLAPALAQAAEMATRLIDVVEDAPDPIGWFERQLQKINEKLGSGDTKQHNYTKRLGEMAGQSDRTGSALDRMGSSADGAAGATGKVGDEAKDAEEELRDLTDAVWAEIDAERAMRESSGRIADALAEVSEKEVDLAKARKAHGKNSAEARAAQDALNDAIREAEGVYRVQVENVKRLAEAEYAKKGAVLGAKDATRLQVHELQRLRDELAPGSPLRKNLDGWIKKLTTEIPGEVTTTVEAIYKVNVKPQGMSETTVRYEGGRSGSTVVVSPNAPAPPGSRSPATSGGRQAYVMTREDMAELAERSGAAAGRAVVAGFGSVANLASRTG